VAPTALALAAVGGTVALAFIEAVARWRSSRATRSAVSTTVAAVAASGGVALVVAALATMRLGPSAGLLAAATACVAVVGALVVTVGGARQD
jgi:hypothetical protein